jgi:fimbrial chaperone protein
MKKTAMVVIRVALAAVFLVGAIAQSAAFSFSPMSVTIGTSGTQAVITFKVVNDSPKQIAVAISVKTRMIAPDGTETNEDVPSMFMVFPSRIVLQPNASQDVRVQYKGSPTIAKELAFRVIADQLPVDFSPATATGVNILLRYVAALYVAPRNVAPKMSLTQAVGAEKNNVRGLTVTVKNEGTKHALLSNPTIRINTQANSSPIEFSGDSMKEINGQNILAASQRTFFVPWAQAAVGVTYEGTFSAEIE